MRTLRHIIRLFLLALLVSCGAGQKFSDLSIGGGSPLNGPSTSLVKIAIKEQSICGGVLIAEDLVLTAAHCVKNDEAQNYTIVFPNSPSDRTRKGIELARVRDDSLNYFPNFDLAWIRLESPAPSAYSPATIIGNSSKIKVENGLTLVGTANETPCHPKDMACNQVKLLVRLKSVWSSPHLINLAVVDSVKPNDSSGTCPGDSGGPAFVSYQGQDLLYGLVAGKDPIFTGGISTSCGSPTSVLTRVGEYQEWIESTSGSKLKIVEPAEKMLSLEFLTGVSVNVRQTNWSDWFTKPLASDSAWITVHKLLEQVVLEFKGQLTAEEIPLLFQAGGQKWLEKLATLKTLTLGFPDQAVAIDDLRPLEGLKNLSELSFLAKPYQGIDVLDRLPKLKTISIVGRVIIQSQQGVFPWAEFGAAEVENLKLSQLGGSHVKLIDWQKLPKLKTLTISTSLGRMSSSAFTGDLQNLTSLQIQEFSCDGSQWPISAMPNLKSLNLRSTKGAAESELSCLRWDLLPNLQEFVVQGYKLNVESFTSGMPPSLAAQVQSQNP